MSIEQEDHILPILTRYFKDDVQEDERVFVKDWIAKSEANKKYFDEVELLWNTSGDLADFDQINVEEEWNTFASKIAHKENTKSTSGRPRVFLKVAASVAIIIGLGMFFVNYFNTEVTIIAKVGNENIFILPDQSVVWLNEGSELTYKKGFKSEIRESRLKGEAFFEVTKNPEKPFVVLANNTETRVLGTSFNLKADTKTKETEIVLVTGKVQFSSQGHQEILQPGDKITAGANGELIKVINHNPNFESWKSGILTFKEATMSEVARDIESYYHMKLVFENPQFEKCTLTSIFDNESLEDILETLTILFDITYKKIDSNRILIKGGDCNS